MTQLELFPSPDAPVKSKTMRFFADPSNHTHRGRFYGIPCYFSFADEDTFSIEGTNVVYDWLVLRIAPIAQWCVETLRWLIEGADYEPLGWQMEALGLIESKSK